MEVHFELFKPEEYEEVIALWVAAGLNMSLSDTYPELLKMYERNPDSFFVLKENERIVGAVIGAFDGRRGYVHHLAVHPDVQGKGYGRLLMDKVTNYFIENGVVKIHLMIDRDNAKVATFYEKLGWHYRDDIILMSKNLRNEQTEIRGSRVYIKDN